MDDVSTDGDILSFRFPTRSYMCAPGQVTISYLREDLLILPWTLRRRRLRAWGFECSCARCRAEAKEWEDWKKTPPRLGRELRYREGERVFFGGFLLGTLSRSRSKLYYIGRRILSRTFFLGSLRLPLVKATHISKEQLEASWWRDRQRLDLGVSAEARLRRWALGLGGPERWRQRAARLRRRGWQEEVLCFHRRLCEELITLCQGLQTRDARTEVSEAKVHRAWRRHVWPRHHRLLSYSAREACEIHLWRGEVRDPYVQTRGTCPQTTWNSSYAVHD